jgi:hypothetical protein
MPARHAAADQILERARAIGDEVERAVEGQRQRRGERDQFARAFAVDAAVGGEHAGDDAGRAGRLGRGDLASHRLELTVVVAEAAAARPHHRHHRQPAALDDERQQARSGRQSVLGQGRAQFQSASACGLGGEPAGERVDDHFDQDTAFQGGHGTRIVACGPSSCTCPVRSGRRPGPMPAPGGSSVPLRRPTCAWSPRAWRRATPRSRGTSMLSDAVDVRRSSGSIAGARSLAAPTAPRSA